MNKKSLTLAAIIGIALGILVLHPLWVSLHAFDGLHSDNESWLNFVSLAYKEVFSFNDLGHLFMSIATGIILSVFVLMLKARKQHKNAGNKN